MPYHVRQRRKQPFEEMPPLRGCEWPGCDERAAYRAPLSPQRTRSYRWFCLDHVRVYNASWNFYEGMSESEIEADRRSDVVWQRPSWRMGSTTRPFAGANVRDDFGVYGTTANRPPTPRSPPTPEEEAMMVLELTPPVTVMAVKARYKELVKRHHPDANGGDKLAEERFKVIHAAYRTVLETLTS